MHDACGLAGVNMSEGHLGRQGRYGQPGTERDHKQSSERLLRPNFCASFVNDASSAVAAITRPPGV